MNEDAIQRQMVEWLTKCVPPSPEGPWWTAVNPAPSKSKATAGRSKALGMKAGTPDIVMCWKGRFIGLEVKQPGKYLSPAQRDVHSLLTMAGGTITTIRSVDELQAFMLVLDVPVRGRLAA